MTPPHRWRTMTEAIMSGALARPRRILRRWRELRQYAAACTQCGYLPEPPDRRGRILSKRLSRLLVWIQVGKIELSGSAHLTIPGPKIIAANHPHSVDP